MGGYPDSLPWAQEPLAPFSEGIQRFFGVNGGGPPTPVQKAGLRLFLDDFPGLAGALHIRSVYPDLVARSPGTFAAPPYATGLGGNLGSSPLRPPSRSRSGPDYSDQPPSEPISAAARKRNAPERRHASKAQQSLPGRQTATPLDTKDNVNDLARIITSEASVGNDAERSSVGFTVLNRMRRNGTARVKGVSSGFSNNQTPTPDAVSLATKILRNQLADPTSGATHFYSPQFMPKEGETTGRADVGGGLEQSGKLPKKNYRFGYAKAFSPVAVPHVREEHFRFYRAPGNGPVQ